MTCDYPAPCCCCCECCTNISPYLCITFDGIVSPSNQYEGCTNCEEINGRPFIVPLCEQSLCPSYELLQWNFTCQQYYGELEGWLRVTAWINKEVWVVGNETPVCGIEVQLVIMEEIFSFFKQLSEPTDCGSTQVLPLSFSPPGYFCDVSGASATVVGLNEAP